MKIYIMTFRYQIETTLAFHCKSAEYDSRTQILELEEHVDHTIDVDKEDILPKLPTTVLTVLDTDIMNVATCDSTCRYAHPVEKISILG